MIATETFPVTKRLKVKCGGRFVEGPSEIKSCGFGQLVGPNTSEGENVSSSANARNTAHRLESQKNFVEKDSRPEPSIRPSGKRRPTGVTEGEKEKRPKLDRGLTVQCSAILKTLMSHPAGWVFSQPVDPVALQIPDYFNFISDPMDLGTVKSKLGKNMYQAVDEFATDVRLTFSNAMLYNPPGNSVHQMAKELRDNFEMKWKLLEDRKITEKSRIGRAKPPSELTEEVDDGREKKHETPSGFNNALLKRSIPSKEKVLKQSSNIYDAEAHLPKRSQRCAQDSARKDLHKGTNSCSKTACSSTIVKLPLSQLASKCGKCGSIACRCNLSTESANVSSELSSERSVVRDQEDSADACGSSLSTSKMHKSDLDSSVDGALDDKNHPSNLCLTPAIDATAEEEWTTSIFDVQVQLSPKKALRAAMLKSRFAETILKAQQKALLDHGDKVDPLKLQQEKERLERRQREERARLEAQVRAAEAVSRMRAEAELKLQRDREREAARAALQKMEKTVEIDQNIEILKELEVLIGESLIVQPLNGVARKVVMGAFDEAKARSPLERLGLFMKDEFLDDEDEEMILHGDGEEGEIFS